MSWFDLRKHVIQSPDIQGNIHYGQKRLWLYGLQIFLNILFTDSLD